MVVTIALFAVAIGGIAYVTKVFHKTSVERVMEEKAHGLIAG